MHVFLFVPYFLILLETLAWFGRPSVSCSSFSPAWCPTDWVKAAATFCMIGMYGGRGDTTISDYTIEHDNLPAISRPSLYCLWDRVECHVISFTGSSQWFQACVDLLLLFCSRRLASLQPSFYRWRQARNYATRVLAISMRGCSVRRCRCCFIVHTLLPRLFLPTSIPPFFLPAPFCHRPSHPTRTAHVTSFHPVSLGIHLVPSRRLSHLPSPAISLPSYQQHLWSSSHCHTLPPTTSPPANLPLNRMPPPLCTAEMSSR